MCNVFIRLSGSRIFYIYICFDVVMYEQGSHFTCISDRPQQFSVSFWTLKLRYDRFLTINGTKHYNVGF